jgi:hypothetical protein
MIAWTPAPAHDLATSRKPMSVLGDGWPPGQTGNARWLNVFHSSP